MWSGFGQHDVNSLHQIETVPAVVENYWIGLFLLLWLDAGGIGVGFMEEPQVECFEEEWVEECLEEEAL
jgi:hypothetical protein